MKLKLLLLIPILAGCSVTVQRKSSETAEETAQIVDQHSQMINRHGAALETLLEDYKARHPEPTPASK